MKLYKNDFWLSLLLAIGNVACQSTQEYRPDISTVRTAKGEQKSFIPTRHQ